MCHIGERYQTFSAIHFEWHCLTRAFTLFDTQSTLESISMNPLQRLKTLFLMVLIAGPAVGLAKAETPDVMAIATLDRFMAAFNDQDIKAWAATLHYPHVRFASSQVMIYDSAATFQDRSVFPALQAAGWHHSLWTSRTITLSSDTKVHIDTEFERRNANNETIGRYRSLYIVTKIEGHWGIQARSSLAP